MKTIASLFSFVFFAGAVASAQLAPSLHYTLDAQSGTTAVNTGSIANANGTLVGAGSGWVEDSPSGTGFSYAISGANSYISAGTVPALNAVGDFTVSLWLKLDAATTNDRIFSTRTSNTSNGFLDLLAGSGSTAEDLRLSLQLKGAASITFALGASNGIDVTDWTFLSVVRSGDTITFYTGGLGGEVVTVLASNSGFSTALMGTDGGDFRIGGTAASTADRSPEGAFNDFRFYDQALSIGQLEALRQTAVPEPGTVALALGGAAAALVLGLRRCRRAA